MFPEKKIMDKVRKEQLEKGVDINQINKEALDFLTDLVGSYRSELINKYNKQASEAIQGLAINKCWTNLSGISKHALDEEINVIKQDEELSKHILNICELKKDVLSTGAANFKDIFKPEYLKKFGLNKEV